MTDDRIKGFANQLEDWNGNLFDEKVEELENWITENEITQDEAEQILEKLPEDYFMRDVLDNIINNSEIFDEEEE